MAHIHYTTTLMFDERALPNYIFKEPRRTSDPQGWSASLGEDAMLEEASMG
jgi:hypothetical protein